MTAPRRGITKENAVELARKGAAAKAVAVRERKLRKAAEDAALERGTAVLMALPPDQAPTRELVRIASEVVAAIGERVLREVDTYPPSALASLASTFHGITRLEGGQSTINVAHTGMPPAERRARILQLAAEVGELGHNPMTGGDPAARSLTGAEPPHER